MTDHELVPQHNAPDSGINDLSLDSATAMIPWKDVPAPAARRDLEGSRGGSDPCCIESYLLASLNIHKNDADSWPSDRNYPVIIQYCDRQLDSMPKAQST